MVVLLLCRLVPAVGLALLAVATIPASAEVAESVEALVARGAYAEAEATLRSQILDPDTPITSEAAKRLEILRRTRYDFSLNAPQALALLREALPGVTEEEFERWTAAGELQHRIIDGETRYFRKAISNLFLISDEAKRRRAKQGRAQRAKRFDLTDHVRHLVKLSESSASALLHPVKHRVTYTLAVKADCERLTPGAKVAAWLPFPQEYGQQSKVRLVHSVPEPVTIAPNGTPHRSVYFERTIEPDGAPPRFKVEFEFTTHAVGHQLDADAVEPYRIDDAYRRYTAERPPHIVFSPEVLSLSTQIVGEETNPLEKARRVFRWVSANIPWCGEMEYAIIPSLSAKGLAACRGDCGVQGMVFITLCRAAGVPARWQSGWATRPAGEGMHDWSEFYVEPWGWLPADASYGVRDDDDPRVRDFFCGGMDPYRLIVNLDYARELVPEKTSFRSEPNDFQRGEVEIDGHNLYFDEWTYKFKVKRTPLD